MNKDQVVDGVGVVQPNYAIIHDECVCESKEEPAVKDDSLLATPHPLYRDIHCDFVTADFSCENSFSYVSTFDHSQDTSNVILSLQCKEDTSNVSLSLQCKEDTSSSENLSNLSSIFPENTKGENIFFPSTPLPNSSNHEDAKKHPEFSNLFCHDLSTSSSNYDVD